MCKKNLLMHAPSFLPAAAVLKLRERKLKSQRECSRVIFDIIECHNYMLSLSHLFFNLKSFKFGLKLNLFLVSC